ncbi:MAG: efflux RND transporter periplasmic adaptor subunit [Gammaproteobacteria bacterium]|nr:efflux RND transporter periplasmic adaptor subunit [Gammaproteobacteria bacterium]
MAKSDSSRWHSLWIVPPIAIGIIILIISVSGKQPPEQEEQSEPTRFVRIINAETTDFTPIAEGYGIVQPAQIWAAVSQVSGRVVYMHPMLRNGGMITAGTELIRIDPADYELALVQAQNELAELNVQGDNADASLAIEKSNLALAEKELARKKKLASQGGISKSSADEAERVMLGSRSLVQNLRNTLALLPVQRKLLASRITQAERDLANTQLSAPFNMRVSGLSVEQHQFAPVGQTLFSGESTDRVEITAQIAMGSLRNLFIGRPNLPADTATLNLNLAEIAGFKPTIKFDLGGPQPAQWDAEFVRISESVDLQTQTIGIIVAVDNPLQKIVPGIRPPLSRGMFVQVAIAGHPQKDKIVIPRSIIRNDQVYLVDSENRLQTRPIKRLYNQQQFTVIDNSLKPGEKIVVSDLVPAVDGMLLKTEVDQALQDSLNFEQ